jgi:hypothetical protein
LAIEDQICQSAHSAQESGRLYPSPSTYSTTLILIGIKSQLALQKIALDLTAEGIGYHMFYEPDDNIGYTSLTTEPIYTEEQRKFFKKFSLYKFQADKAYSILDQKEVA